MLLKDIPLRDPFIFADKHTKTYYLYGSVKIVPSKRNLTFIQAKICKTGNTAALFFPQTKRFGVRGIFGRPRYTSLTENTIFLPLSVEKAALITVATSL